MSSLVTKGSVELEDFDENPLDIDLNVKIG